MSRPVTDRVITPLSEQPAFVAAFAAAITKAEGSVCEVCGLEIMGHAPESEWLGHESHPFTPIPATPEMKARASVLTGEAYRARRKGSASH